MKAIIILLSAWIALLLSACETDYDIGLIPGSFRPQVVVNGIINPDSTITVRVCWNKYYMDKSNYKSVDLFRAYLYENDSLIADKTCSGGIFICDRYPKAGAKYKIIISVPSYGEASACTSIPEQPEARVRLEKKTNSNFSSYYHFRQESFRISRNCRAAWIKTFSTYKRETVVSGPEYPANIYIPDSIVRHIGGVYADNPYFDQVNSVLSSEDAAEKGSNMEFENFVRIPSRNILHAFPSFYSISVITDTYKFVPTDPVFPDYPLKPVNFILSGIFLQFIAPSDEYDQYFRSLYKQNALEEDPSLPLFHETVHVYSNIKNGLGIFAGYNSTLYIKTL